MTDTSSVVRARLAFSYDGTDFAGWAIQPALRTVQGVMEGALARIVRGDDTLRMTVAGRTDAGVHARIQYGHVDIGAGAWSQLPRRSPQAPAAALRDRLNGVLPRDIRVHAVDEAPPGFDARFSAEERRYAYRVADGSARRDPMRRRDVLWYKRALDVDALNAASAELTGLRDFVPFCRPRPGATTIRSLVQFSWERPMSGADAGLTVATLRADAFCHSMVRSVVGAVLAVGDGRRDIDWLLGVASSPERSQAVTVAAPHALCLEEVSYPSDALMAERAALTRARRSLD